MTGVGPLAPHRRRSPAVTRRLAWILGAAAIVPRRGAAVAVLAACLAMVAFSTASVALPSPEPLPSRPPLVNVLLMMSVFATFPSVGAVLAILRPTNPMGWLLLAIGYGFTIGPFSTEYAGRSLYGGLPLPAVTLVAWLGSWGFTLGVGLAVTIVPLLFPSGRVRGRIWRVVTAGAIVLIAAAVGSQMLLPPSPDDPLAIANPIAVAGQVADVVLALNMATLPAIAILGLVSVGSLAARFRSSRGIERQQLKWLLLATILFVVTIVGATSTQADAWFYAMLVCAASIPVAVGIAVLRHRLYEIDRLISRTLAYLVLTAILGTVFVGVIVGLEALLTPVTDGDTLAVAASTLVAAALFQPLRGRIQRLVDRRFNRSRVNAENVIVGFGERLRSETDLATIHRDVVSAIDRSVQPRGAALWVRGGAE